MNDYDDRASTLALHDPIWQVDGCATHPVPLWAKAFLRAATHFVRLAPAQGRPLLTDPADHNLLLQLAEGARLRPPQPPAGSHPVGDGVEWFYRELKETGPDAEPIDHISRLFSPPRPSKRGTR